MRVSRRIVLLTFLAVTACGDDGPQARMPVATFLVADTQTYKIALATPELVDHATRLMEGEELPAIPNWLIVRGDPSVNAPWSWHIDPASLEFADMTIELCDGLPEYVEDGSLTSDRYCPWIADVIAIE